MEEDTFDRLYGLPLVLTQITYTHALQYCRRILHTYIPCAHWSGMFSSTYYHVLRLTCAHSSRTFCHLHISLSVTFTCKASLAIYFIGLAKSLWPKQSCCSGTDTVWELGKGSRLYNIPFETLRWRTNHILPPTEDEEHQLAVYCVKMADMGFDQLEYQAGNIPFRMDQLDMPGLTVIKFSTLIHHKVCQVSFPLMCCLCKKRGRQRFQEVRFSVCTGQHPLKADADVQHGQDWAFRCAQVWKGSCVAWTS